MITQESIDKQIASFESNPAALEKTLDKIETSNADLIDILIGTPGELLTEDEMDYLIFLFGVIYHVVDGVHPIPNYDEDEITKVEEEVWQVINDSKNFDKSIEIFYETLHEKEIVDFIEISIADIEDSEIVITDPGRVIMLAVLISLCKITTQTN